MAKRKSTRRISTDEVMGDGSYVIAKSIPYSVVRKALQMDDGGMSKLEQSDYVSQIIIDALVKWDWVDYDDKPLDVPTTIEELVETINTSELKFLISELIGSESKAKN